MTKYFCFSMETVWKCGQREISTLFIVMSVVILKIMNLAWRLTKMVQVAINILLFLKEKLLSWVTSISFSHLFWQYISQCSMNLIEDLYPCLYWLIISISLNSLDLRLSSKANCRSWALIVYWDPKHSAHFRLAKKADVDIA